MLGLIVPPSVNQVIILVKESAVLSIIIFGSIVYVISPLRRGHGLRNEPTSAGAPAG